MRKLSLLFFFMLLSGVNATLQKAEKFFPATNLMPVGAYYYSEHWDRTQWSRDLTRSAELGFSFIHMAEFAWANLEPTNPGEANHKI